jgi:two-component system sensor histidine kinase DesK
MLKVTEGQVVLTVENDGMRSAGAQADAGRSVGAGSGLAGLRERLAVVDGTLEAGPVAGEAFRVAARVPLGPAGPWAASGPSAESATVSGTPARGSSAAAVAGGTS